MQIIPYTEIDGIRTLKDSQVRAIFERMDPAAMFPQGSVRCADDLLMFWKNYAIAHVIEHEGEIIWAAWLTGLQPTHAYGHFCKLGGKVPGRVLVKQSLDYWWSVLPLSVIIGLIPEDNRPAINLMRRAGFTVRKPIKNMLYNVHTGRKTGAVIVEAHHGA
jgi:hypothetical protein